MFDAGSSHTSLFVYRWPADKENDTGVVSQALACQVKGQFPQRWAVLGAPAHCLDGLPSRAEGWEVAQAGLHPSASQHINLKDRGLREVE